MAKFKGYTDEKVKPLTSHAARGRVSKNIEDVADQSASDRLIDEGQAFAGHPAPETSTAATGVPMAGRFSGYPAPAGPSAITERPYGPVEALDEFLRNINDTMTFGLWDKALEASGYDPQASEKTANSNPIAKVAGQTIGGMAPGFAFSKAASMIPALARNELLSVAGNNAVASGATSATDQLIREGRIDPTAVVTDTVLGGALGGGLHAIAPVVSPGAKVRQRGTRLTPAEKQAMRVTAAQAEGRGIDLTIPEIADAVVPHKAAGTGLSDLDAYATAQKSGSRAVRDFEAQREPRLIQAGRDIADTLPAIRPFDLQRQAQDAIQSVREGFQSTARPYFDASMGKKIPPNTGKSMLRKVPYVREFAQATSKDAGKMLERSNELGRPMKINDIAFLDTVQQAMKGKANQVAESDPDKSGILKRSAKQVLDVIDQYSRGSHAQGRAIHGQGQDAIAELEAGPLGAISKSAKASTQGKALFAPATGMESEAAIDAVGHLPTDTAQGILSNHLDAALSGKNPANWARNATTEHGMPVVEKAMGSSGRRTADTIRLARMADAKEIGPHVAQTFGFLSPVLNYLKDYGSRGVAEKLRDPRWIERLGKKGPLEATLAQMLESANRAATRGRGEKDKKDGNADDNILHILIGG